MPIVTRIMRNEDTLKQRCPICASNMEKLFSTTVLLKYDVDYFRCLDCGLIQTEQPYWLDEAYDSAITDLDVGLVQRNLELSEKVSWIIDRYFDTRQRFLDFAGGYGLFVRLMRDKGFNFSHHDDFCDNLFAKYFSLSDLDNADLQFELVTAFEFFEHVSDPIIHCKKMLSLSDSILFTTELAPDYIKSVDDWWYFIQETGQHITFYSRQSLILLAQKMGADLYTDGVRLHAISRRKSIGLDLSTEKTARSGTGFGSRFLAAFRAKPQVVRNQSISIQHDYNFIKRLMSR